MSFISRHFKANYQVLSSEVHGLADYFILFFARVQASDDLCNESTAENFKFCITSVNEETYGIQWIFRQRISKILKASFVKLPNQRMEFGLPCSHACLTSYSTNNDCQFRSSLHSHVFDSKVFGPRVKNEVNSHSFTKSTRRFALPTNAIVYCND